MFKPGQGKAKSELTYSLTVRDRVQPAHLYVHIPPCSASSRSIKQTQNLNEKMCAQRRRHLPWWTMLIPRGSAWGPCISALKHPPCQPIAVPGADAAFTHAERSLSVLAAPTPGCSIPSRACQEPRPQLGSGSSKSEGVWGGAASSGAHSPLAG